jgi:hypothetical protein
MIVAWLAAMVAIDSNRERQKRIGFIGVSLVDARYSLVHGSYKIINFWSMAASNKLLLV